MIKDITIGQYFPGNSVIHRLDPRVKILLVFAYIVAVFLCKNFYSLGLMILLLTVIILLSGISLKLIYKSIKPIFIIVLITSLLQLIYNKNGDVLFEYWKIRITTGGVFTAIFTTVRIAALVAASSMLTYTTSPTMLTDAIERLFSPLKVFKINVHSIAMMMTIALRFIPTLIDEVDKIMAAQKSRGADLESGNIVDRGKALVPIFIPLFINSFRRAYELAFAMECRCYQGGEGRTRLKVMKVHARDFVAIFIMALVIAGIIVLNHFFAAVI
ncbi:MAG: energy-coupling factor transporter transmembrane protein EcfT [Ruminococcaceae bacterium]|nr:energy-coupling factor transporter transmembrane protein EcfT [Oscillospiraceae bacterium]